ncbi:hypothetical protein DKP78_15070, partial [Enterococcus faecium]
MTNLITFSLCEYGQKVLFNEDELHSQPIPAQSGPNGKHSMVKHLFCLDVILQVILDLCDVGLEPHAQFLHLGVQGGTQVLGGLLQLLLEITGSALKLDSQFLCLGLHQLNEGAGFLLCALEHVVQVGLQAATHGFHLLTG